MGCLPIASAEKEEEEEEEPSAMIADIRQNAIFRFPEELGVENGFLRICSFEQLQQFFIPQIERGEGASQVSSRACPSVRLFFLPETNRETDRPSFNSKKEPTSRRTRKKLSILLVVPSLVGRTRLAAVGGGSLRNRKPEVRRVSPSFILFKNSFFPH